MDLPKLHGIVPPLPTPILDDESIDVSSLHKLVEFAIKGGVHGLWVLGTTARFDLIPDSNWRVVAENVAAVNAGRVPMVLNISDQGTTRTLRRAEAFDDLPYDYYAALPPWYQPMTPGEVIHYFETLADRMAKPLVIYNAPWVCNQLSFENLRRLADHPRIVGTKDVTSVLHRTLDWSQAERRRQNFSYLQGTDNLAMATDLGADGFVSSLTNPVPELAVAIWDAVRAGDPGRAFTLQSQFNKLAQATTWAPMLACLEVFCQKRGILKRMLPAPLKSADAETSQRILKHLEVVGLLPT